MVHYSSKVTCALRVLSATILVLASLAVAGCAMLRPAPEATLEPTPSPSPSPSPTPAPIIAIEAGEPVSGMVDKILAQENGVYMFSFASPDINVTVLANKSAFIDEIGSRAECVSPGDRVEIIFDSPIIAGDYAQGEAQNVKTLMYADSGDYNDPFFTAFKWMFESHEELNENAVAIAFPPKYGAEPTAQFELALQSFCLQNGYSVKAYFETNDRFLDSVANDWLVCDFTSAVHDGDTYVISVIKTRKHIGEAGATLTLTLDNGVWSVVSVKNESINMA